MEITWHGHSCFTIKGKDTTVITDPYSEEIGLKLPSLNGDILTISHNHPGHNNQEKVQDSPRTLTSPGEYEIKGVPIVGVEAWHYLRSSEDEEDQKRGKVTLFHFIVDGIKICHLGDLCHKLTPEMIDALGDIDILLIPVGGNHTLGGKKAHGIVESLEPKIVIPMHYKIEGLNIEEIDPVDLFFKEFGVSPEIQDSFKIKDRSELPSDKTEIIALKAITA